MTGKASGRVWGSSASLQKPPRIASNASRSTAPPPIPRGLHVGQQAPHTCTSPRAYAAMLSSASRRHVPRSARLIAVCTVLSVVPHGPCFVGHEGWPASLHFPLPLWGVPLAPMRAQEWQQALCSGYGPPNTRERSCSPALIQVPCQKQWNSLAWVLSSSVSPSLVWAECGCPQQLVVADFG